MKEKILLALKTKFANLGFTDKAFDGVATFLAATVKEDSEVETAVSGVEPMLKVFQGETDSRVNSAIAKTKEELTKKEEPGTPGPNDPPKEETATEKMLREMAEGLKAVTQELNTLKSGGVLTNRKTAIEAALEKAPANFKLNTLKDFERYTFKDDADFEAWKNDVITTRLPDAIKIEGESSVKGITAAPISGVPATNGKTSTFAESMKAVVDSRLEAKAAAAPGAAK